MFGSGAMLGDRFELLTQVGSGGMGVVYRARDHHTDHMVAVKIVTVDGEELGERFAREARILAELDHPGIVRYIAHGQTPAGQRWLAMEWLEGEDLGQRLQRQPLSPAEALTVVRRAGEALGDAHARGVVHRDIKPTNLFLVDGLAAGTKVIDFGVARVRSGVGLTRTGHVVGTPRFMAPEQARGEGVVDARADVFALGCVLYGCLTGRHAFSGDDEMAVLAKVLFEDPVPASKYVRIPPGVDALIDKMLAKQREVRLADGAAVAAEVARLQAADSDATMAERPAPRTLTEGERRLLSIIVVQGGSQEALAEVAGEHGGRVERLRDGSHVAVLSAPGPATDRAVRAARCALAMRERAGGAPMALATGWGLVAARAPVGEVIDEAVQLLRGGRPGLAVDNTTAGLLAGEFEVAGVAGSLELRGARANLDATRTLLGRPTPFVGREREMAMIDAAFLGAIDGAAAVVLVTAPAGVGKSRLRREFVARHEGLAEMWIGRGDPLRALTPNPMIAQVIPRVDGVLDGEPLEARRSKLAARIARTVPAPEAQRITEFLGELVGVPFPDNDSVPLRAARQDRALLGDQVRRAFEDWVGAETATRPVVVILEDLHWGDMPTVQALDDALRGLPDRPLFVLAMARPEVHDLFPQLWNGRGVTQIALPGLPRKAGERLAAAVLGDRATPEKIVQMVERAGGNAFYLEELIRVAAEGDAEVPETVLAMVTARLEALPAGARRVLRAASVFGDLFWRGGVAALVGHEVLAEVDSWLGFLGERELVKRRPSSRFPGEEELQFRHALVREAAYGTLTEDDRRTGHRLAGAWLEGAGEGDAIVLAGHFDLGGDPARAVRSLRRAAEQALDANDLAGALARVARAVACGAMGQDLGELRLLEAQAANWRGDFPAVERAAREAMTLLEEGTTSWCAAARELAVMISRRGSGFGELAELVDPVLRLVEADATTMRITLAAVMGTSLYVGGRHELATRLHDGIRAHVALHLDDPRVALAWHGFISFYLDEKEPMTALEATRRTVALREQIGDRRGAALWRANLGGALLDLGIYDRAESELRKAIIVADRLGILGIAAHARAQLGAALEARGAADEATQVLSTARDSFHAIKAVRWEGLARTLLARIRARTGDLEGAEGEARQAVEITPTAGPAHAVALAGLAAVHLAQGRPAAALEVSRRARAMARAAGSAEGREMFLLLTHAEALYACDETDEAKATIADASAQLLARADRIGDADARASFLAKVKENATILEHAAAWR